MKRKQQVSVNEWMNDCKYGVVEEWNEQKVENINKRYVN